MFALLVGGFGTSLAVAQVGKISGTEKAKIVTVCRKKSGAWVKLRLAANRVRKADAPVTARGCPAPKRIVVCHWNGKRWAGIASTRARAKRLVALGDMRPAYGSCAPAARITAQVPRRSKIVAVCRASKNGTWVKRRLTAGRVRKTDVPVPRGGCPTPKRVVLCHWNGKRWIPRSVATTTVAARLLRGDRRPAHGTCPSSGPAPVLPPTTTTSATVTAATTTESTPTTPAATTTTVAGGGGGG
ncbi:MAG TPA: hypothetical protein VJ986_14220, partial [Gaiellaceae bacterium]|nr:hypothetical protein [Gaiellaceae bacterium]